MSSSYDSSVSRAVLRSCELLRFQVVISMAEERGVFCISQMMFVHYNSKHTKAKSLAKNDECEF